MSKTSSQDNQLKNPDLLKIGDASKKLGVSIDTLRRWERKGRITPKRTLGGTRLYSLSQLESIISPSAPLEKLFESLEEESPSTYRSTPSKPSLHQHLVEKPIIHPEASEDTPLGSPYLIQGEQKAVSIKHSVFKVPISLASKKLYAGLLMGAFLAIMGTNHLVNHIVSNQNKKPQDLDQNHIISLSSPRIGQVLAASTGEVVLDLNTNTNINGKLTVNGDAVLTGKLIAPSIQAGNVVNTITGSGSLTVDNTNPNDPVLSITLPSSSLVNGIVGGATLKAGTDIGIASSSGTLTFSDSSTLDTVTGRGASTGNSITTGGLTANGSTSISGATTISDSGTASSPALYLSGTIYSGGTSTTTKPLALIEPSGTASTGWSTSGTVLGINTNSSFAGNLLDVQKAATSELSLDSSGNLTVAGNIRANGTLVNDWQRISTALSPIHSGDNITTSGNISTTGSGTITSAGAFSGPTLTNTINGLIINSGALSGITTLSASNTITLSGLTASSIVATDGSKNLTSSFASSVLASSLTDETGSGSVVFGTSPTISSATISSPTITGGSINNTPIGGTSASTGNFSSISLNGTNINTAGTLSNVAYLNQANSFSTSNTFSVNGAASTPAESLTGTWYSAGTATATKPQLLIEPSGATSNNWSTNGTGLGINAASGFSGNLANFQVNGSSKFSVDSAGNLAISGTFSSGGQTGGTLTLTPTTDTTALTLVGTNVLTKNLAYFNTNNTQGTIFDIAYGSAQTLAGALTGTSIDLDSGQVTTSNNDVTGLSVKLPTVTDSNTTGTVNIKGLSFGFGSGTGINQTGAGATIYDGVAINLPALTQTSGTLTGNGIDVTTSSQITTGGTANGVNINASGIGSGSLNALNISSITASTGTETALNIGSGWDSVLKVNGTTEINSSGVTQVAGGGTGLSTYTAGDLIYSDTINHLTQLAGGSGNNGKILTISSGVPVWASSVSGGICGDCVLNDPTSAAPQTIAPTTDIPSLVVKQTSSGTPTHDIFDITSSNGATKYFYVDSSGNVSTGSISNTTLTLTPTSNTTALTLVGTNVSTANLAYFNSKNASGNIFNIAYGASQTLSGTLKGINIDLSTNLTATNQNVSGTTITLPSATNTNTSGTQTLYGLDISDGGGLNQNGTGGTTTFAGANITVPALTQTLGTINGYGVNITTPSSITTGGTAAGVNINASGIGAGTLYGLDISGITAGSGAETGINVGPGWDYAATFQGNVGIGMANPSYKLDLSGSFHAAPGSSSVTPFSSGFVVENSQLDVNLLSAGTTNATNVFFGNGSSNREGAITFNNDVSEGLGFRTGGNTTQMVINSSGNIGIGTTGPSNLLDVGDNESNTDWAKQLSVADSSGPSGIYIGQTSTNGLDIGWQYNATTASAYGLIQTSSGGGNIILARDRGKVGIGMANPQYLLNLKGAAQTPLFKLSQGGSDNGWAFYSDNSSGSYIECYDISGSCTHYSALDTNGNLTIKGTLTQSGTPDIAENIPVTDSSVEAGDVVMVDPSFTPDPSSDIYQHGAAKKTSTSYSSGILGVISSDPGIVLNAGSQAVDNGQRTPDGQRPLVLGGRVPTKVSTENGPINIGDYLTSSSTPGVAMKATKPGATVGKALESYYNPDPTAVGKILVFVNVSYADPSNILSNMTLDQNGAIIMPKLSTNSLQLSGIQSANLDTLEDSLDPSTLSQVGDAVNSGSDSSHVDLATTINTIIAAEDETKSELASLSSQIAGVATQSAKLSSQVASQGTQIASASAALASTQSGLASTSANIASISASLAKANMKLTDPSNLFASNSASFNSVNVADTLSTLKLNTIDATVSGTLNVLSPANLATTTIDGDLNIDGTFSVTSATDGTNLNALTALHIQNSPLAQLVDFFNGLVKVDNKGTLTVQKISVASNTLGTATIPAGQTQVTVSASALTNNSKIFTSVNDSPVSVAVTDKSVVSGQFTLKISQTQSQDLKIDWWIVDQGQ